MTKADLLASMRKLAESAGIDVEFTDPSEPPPLEVAPPVREKVDVYIAKVIRDMCLELGGVLGGEEIFLRGRDVVLVDATTNGFWVMSAEMFVSWVERYVRFFKRKGEDQIVFESIGVDKARVVLNSLDFRSGLRRITGVRRIRMPVAKQDEDGEWTLRRLPVGHDAETGIFTLGTGADYREDMRLEEAVGYLTRTFGSFPFAGKKPEASATGDLQAWGRSFGVHLAAMLSVFCADLLPARAKAPLFLYNSNLPGSGKSTLVNCALLAVHGSAGNTTIWESQEQFRKELDAAAQDLVPFLFFDDFKGLLQNNLLNAWITMDEWEGRVLGSNQRFRVPVRCVNFLTGNKVGVDEDMGRRTLICDLFAEQTVDRREVPADRVEISPEWANVAENQADLLAALWALVRNFYTPERLSGRKITPKPSFVAWSRLVPQMVVDAGFSDPLESVQLPDAGASESTDREKVVLAAVATHLSGGERVVTLRLEDLAELARGCGAFVNLLGTVEDVVRDLDNKNRWPVGPWPEHTYNSLGHICATKMTIRRPENEEERQQTARRYLESSVAMKFGRRIRRALGGTFYAAGVGYRFGTRESASVSTFELVRLENLTTSTNT